MQNIGIVFSLTVYTIGYPKRGHPHARVLLIVDPQDKPQTPDDYDKIISAEIPDRTRYPFSYDIVVKNMIHGPCSLLNMNAELGCSKQYQKILLKIHLSVREVVTHYTGEETMVFSLQKL